MDAEEVQDQADAGGRKLTPGERVIRWAREFRRAEDAHRALIDRKVRKEIEFAEYDRATDETNRWRSLAHARLWAALDALEGRKRQHPAHAADCPLNTIGGAATCDCGAAARPTSGDAKAELKLISRLLTRVEAEYFFNADDGIVDGHSARWHALYILGNASQWLGTGAIPPRVYDAYTPVFTRPGDNWRKEEGT